VIFFSYNIEYRKKKFDKNCGVLQALDNSENRKPFGASLSLCDGDFNSKYHSPYQWSTFLFNSTQETVREREEREEREERDCYYFLN
jgi:hypothetical protein